MIEVTAADTHTVWSRAIGAPLGLQCFATSVGAEPPPVSVTSSTGVVAGSTCDALTLRHSGLDTLVLRAGLSERRVPIALAAPAELGSVTADRLTIDDLPPGAISWWAPSARLNSRGEVELYATAYEATPPDTMYRGSLYRLVQVTPSDSLHFRFDGVVLRPDTNPCSLMNTGIENIAMVRRAEGDGFRMFLSAGSFDCNGWQVFSAVSSDERTWSLERGIRVPNSDQWPVGEGMALRELHPTGEWQMIVGGVVPELGRSYSDFEIVEWRSMDQLTWAYYAAVFSLKDLGLPPGRSLYSPTVREFAPGLYRMVFAEDGSSDLTTATRLYTAISAGGEHWRFEGTLLDAPAIQVFYASVIGDRLYTLSAPPTPADIDRYLSAFTLRMP